MSVSQPVTRHDWTLAEVKALFQQPFNDLLFQAQSVHRQHFDANRVQVSTLLSIKTGACPEDCKYCPQSGHYNTGLDKEKLMEVEKVLKAAAEAKAHGKTPETVMFHEVGAVDSIVDVCSVAICLDDLGIEDIVVESLSEGHGTIRCAHGLMPIPVPAVVNLCQAGNIALTPAPVAGELVTPTGAAIVTALRTSDQLPSRYRIEAVGYGAGKRPYEGCSGTLRCLLVHVDA